MTDSFDKPAGVTIFLSGQRIWIADYSGLPIETSLFGSDRFVKVTISGQPVVSTISLSGLSIPSNVSGNVVYLTSGQNPVQMSGQVVYFASGFNEIAGSFTANVSGQPVRISGETVIALISGQTVVASVTTNISGQTVYFASGQNPVQMSGQTIWPVSGKAYTQIFDPSGVQYLDAWTNASGQHRMLVSISGEIILASVSGNMVSVSGQAISVSGNMVSISGQVVNISGNIVNTSGQVSIISGQPVLVSGQLVAVSGIIATSISGNMVSVSGQSVNISGNVVNTSGQIAIEVGSLILTNTPTTITSLSGGTELSSGSIFSVTVRNQSGNNPIWLGGVSGNAPFSGKGIILFGNDSQSFKVDNFNKVRLFASTSGQRVTFAGVQQ